MMRPAKVPRLAQAALRGAATSHSSAAFKPILYMKPGCPFCSNLAVWLASARLDTHFEWQWDSRENRALIDGKCANGKVTFPTIQHEEGKFMNETFDIMRKLTEEHDVDNSKLIAWDYMVKSAEQLPGFTEGSAGPSVMQRYFYLLKYAKDHHEGSLDKVKANLFNDDVKIPSLVPDDGAKN